MKQVYGYITAPRGFRAAGVSCGIKREGKDLALIVCETDAAAAGTFTTNRFCAAPVSLSRERLRSGRARAVIVNSGCANSCTGEEGIRDAERVIRSAARILKLDESGICIASTGRIGSRLPVELIEEGLEPLAAGLSEEGGRDAALAILTTDSCVKEAVARINIGGAEVTIGGMAKGAGMVYPNMATMLAFITTDAAVSSDCLQRILLESVERSFNCISVDGDRSTNDSVIALASGLAGNSVIESIGSKEARIFEKALNGVTGTLAEQIVRDGEGASKFIEIIVRGAADRTEARRLAFAVANSPLFKAAIYGEDPNWGRIVSAIGAAGVALDPDRVEVKLQGECVFKGGAACGADRDTLAELLRRYDVAVSVGLDRGAGEARVLTCDLTPQYVDLNSS
jgi:glutamate N-acetyltransferase/amino-acid N-acetyltransferase